MPSLATSFICIINAKVHRKNENRVKMRFYFIKGVNFWQKKLVLIFLFTTFVFGMCPYDLRVRT